MALSWVHPRGDRRTRIACRDQKRHAGRAAAACGAP